MNQLSQAITEAEALLLKASLNPSLDNNLSIAFGNNYNVTIANNIFSSWSNGDFSNLPKIEVISPTAMNGAQGAYSALNNTIFLSSSLMESKSPKKIRNVLLEEYGHFIDAQINTLDTPGDEGEIWRNLVLNRKMSAEQLDTLRSENDWGTITVDGQILNIEKSVITLNVNTTLDENDGSATTGNGLSLRDAIIIANNDTNNEYIINLASGQTYFLTLGTSGEDNALGGDLDIKNGAKVTVRTNGNSPATINGTTIVGGDIIFNVLSGGTLTLEKLVVTGGQHSFTGGGIRNDGGTLTIVQSTIRNNSASYDGGGIYNGGTLNIVQSTISNNSGDYGGGIRNDGTLNIAHSSISSNSANFGGGIYNSGGTLNIVHSTISTNSASYDGGGIVNYSVALAINTTITNNRADANNYGSGNGGGVYNVGTFATRNSIIAGNFDTPNNAGSGTKHPDVSGSIQGNAYNLIGNRTGASGTIGTGSDIVLAEGQTAGLGALANNGGFTQTHALLSGSPAINAGLNALIGNDLADIDGDGNTTEPVPFDQRGNGYSRISGGRVDIGAFEFRPLPTLSINNVNIIEGNSGTKNAVFTVSLTVTEPQPVNVSFNFATADGTATAGSDYDLIPFSARGYASGMVGVGTITVDTISVVINGDTIFEPDETFFVNLTNVTGATVTKTQGRGTIINDDGLLIRGDGNNNNLEGTSGDDTLRGLGGNDTLQGFRGNDILDGGTGADSMIGGTGNDTYYVDNTGDRVIENANQGIDTVRSSITYTLPNNVENLILQSSANRNGTGNILNNRITGNSGNNRLNGATGNDTLLGAGGNDTLNGGLGADSMFGGSGNDTYYVENTGDRVTENTNQGTDTVRSTINYTLGNNLENLILEGSANRNGTGNTLNNRITGNSANNRLNGGDGNDTLLGAGGNDTLNGGTGADSMFGGSGNDTYYVENTGDRVTENTNQGTDTVRSNITYTLGNNLENLILEGTANINGIGNTLNNSITGNSGNNSLSGGSGSDTLLGGNGNDTLNGGIGADSMVGGTGNDTYYVDNTGDRVIENANQGTDTVRSTITYILGNNLENLILEGSANRNGTGNTLDNRIVGNSAKNRLNGGDGNDTLLGAGGNDTLIGGSGNDSLNGGNGNDTLIGGSGNDTLTGGSGNDFFRFNSPGEGVDRITDFNVTDDTILIKRSGFGGGLSLGTLSPNQFRLGSSASTPNHRFFYNPNYTGLFFDVDGNGVNPAVRIATLSTALNMNHTDILVI